MESIYNSYLEDMRIKSNHTVFYPLLKRVIDICGVIAGLILLAPLFIIVSIAIKWEDPKGTVFFAQERVGKNGKIFKFYKFRSMVHNAEELLESLIHLNEVDGPAFKIKDDPRITKVGKFIRKTSIDELPQLINILKGEMSFVGPRPPLPREVEQYDAYQMQRLKVKGGLTCYWQIGGRNETTFDEWVELDLKYIEDMNVFLDLSLIFKTMKVFVGDDTAA